MLIHTTLGAAKVVAQQAPAAIRPDNPTLHKAAAAPSAAQLQHNVNTSLNTLFLILAGVALIVGAVGIANTTLVAVLERAGLARVAAGITGQALSSRGWTSSATTSVSGRGTARRPLAVCQ